MYSYSQIELQQKENNIVSLLDLWDLFSNKADEGATEIC